MLAGEYAVLRGGHALAVTLSCGMNVKVSWDNHAAHWEILSNLWSEPKFVYDDHTPQVDMLCRAVQFAAKRCGMHGGRVEVSSDIEIKHGIGSSSALRLGICTAFYVLKNGIDTSRPGGVPLDAVNAAWQLQSEGQGVASGYDIATQFAGGLVEFNYEYHDNKWKPHWFKHDLNHLAELVHVFVGGKGAPTGQTTQTTSSWLEGANRTEKLLETSEALIDAFNIAIQWPQYRNTKRLIGLSAAMRQLFAGSPHFPTLVADELQSVKGCDQTWSWKTTGAGGEDAILLIGQSSDIAEASQKLWDIGWHRLDSHFSSGGTKIISIGSSEKSSLSPRKSPTKIMTETPRD